MKKLGIAVGAAVAVVVIGLAYVWFSGGTGEPSTEVTAPPLNTTLPVTTEASTPPEPVPSDTTRPPTTEEQPEQSSAPTTTDAAPPGTGAEGRSTGDGPVLYRIDKEQSSVRFEIDELLNGVPKRVVGVTTEVAGEILIDFDDPAASQVGLVVINVRTLETDSSFRDRAMRGPILGSARDENEFATFAPTALEGLPDAVALGDRVAMTVTGDFTLSGVTRPVVFETEVDVVSSDRIEVTGSARVLRSDFGLTIPEVPSVSDVSDEILLVIELVASAA